MQTLSQLLADASYHDGTLEAHIDACWMQGRSAYGGIQAALAVTAMLPHSDGFPIRTVQATLCAPIPAGPVRIQSRMLRKGGNTRQIEARILQGEETLALFVGIFGRERESVVARDFRHPEPDTDAGVEFPYIEGMTPRFLQQFESALLKGHFPGAGKPDTQHIFRLSLKDEATQASLQHVLAMADYPPPIGLSWINSFTPASTMTWMLNFTGHPFAGQNLANWIIDVQLDAAHDGYTQQTVTLFSPDGFAIARGTQCMVVFG